MIIECPKCKKNFEVNSSLIPEIGRKIQCGSCNHIWFYRLKIVEKDIVSSKDEIDLSQNNNIKIKNTKLTKEYKKTSKYNKKKSSSLSLSKILSYLLVFIISFVALIIILDTFKNPLSNVFPNLELFLYNLYETLKDIILFIKNLLI